jgi:DeoR/GlpR family transcriptional regulator of sugar metabolism
MTVRRDLDQLADQGQLERIHGGARLSDRTSEELSHHLRASQNAEEKEQIALAALSLIQDGETVALDASTSCLSLAKLLRSRDIQAVVTSLDAAEVLASAGVPFILVGGTFHAPARSFVGGFFHHPLSRLHPDKVFFSAKGYTPETGFTDPYLPEVEAKIGLNRSATLVIALMDSSKFGRRSLATIANTDEVDVVITDTEPAANILEAFQEADVRLIVADPARHRSVPHVGAKT